jgi:TPR repeat protein
MHEGLQGFAKAFEWYKHLGWLVDEEYVLKSDDESVLESDDENCSIDYQRSHISLGLLYEYGDGVKQDDEMVIEY